MRKQILILYFFCLAITGCGFHLRGIQDVPKWLTNVYIINNSGNAGIERTLQSMFDAYQISIQNDPKLANVWIIINNADFKQQIVGVGTGSNPRQYQLTYRLRYRVEKPDGTVLQPNSTLLATRQLTVNNDRVLGSDEEAELLVSEMRQETVIKLMNQLR